MKLLSRGTNGKQGYTATGRQLQAAVNGVGGQRRLFLYLGALIFGVCALSALSILHASSVGSGWAIAVLGVSAAVSEKQRVSLSSETQASISVIPILFAAVLFGPAAAMLVAAISNLGAFERPYMKWAVYTCSNSITGALAGFAAVIGAALASGELAKVAAGTALAALTAE